MIASVLSPADIEAILAGAHEVLETVGMVLPHDGVLDLLADAGARVCRDEKRTYLPAELVGRLVAGAGRRFALSGRDPARTAEFGFGKRNYNSIAGEALWVENPGDERRYCCLEDVARATRLADALPSINIPGAMADPQELPPDARCVSVMRTMLENTTKPFLFWFGNRQAAGTIVDMLVALRGSAEAAARRPITYPLLEPISPLRYPFNGVDLLFETSRINMPVAVGPMAQMGVSAPCTIAGTLVMETAEVLGGICVTQVVNPGTPVIFGGICHALDMRTTQMIFAGPEQAIFGVAMAQVGRHLGLPVYINVGLTDSKLPDAQAGMEAGITLAMGAAAGADVFGHLGICGVDQASSLDMLVMQAELVRYVESALRPIDTSPAALAVDEIRDAGPGGRYIDRMHTARNFRRELWFPELMDRYFYDQWRAFGATSLQDRCCMRRAEIEAKHTVEPLEPGLARELDRIMARPT